MTSLTLLLIFFLAIAGLAFGLARLLSLIAQIHRIRRTPVVSAALLPTTGQAALAGAAHGALLTSPFAGVPCVFWSIQVQEYRSTGRSGAWHTVVAQSSNAPLLLDDGTGQVQVQPEGAALTLFDRFSAQQRRRGSLSGVTRDALERLGVPTRTWLGTARSLRIYERQVRDGERVFVLGTLACWDGRAMLASAPNAPLLLADRDVPVLIHQLYMRTLRVLALPLLILLVIALIGIFG